MNHTGRWALGGFGALVLLVATPGCSTPRERSLALIFPSSVVTPETSQTTPDATPTTVETVETVPGTAAEVQSSTETTTAATDPTGVASGSWVDATEGLAGLSSECGNMALVSARPDRPGLIASVALQGLWAADAGEGTWTRIGTSGAPITNRGTSIVYDPDHPDTFWESGVYNGGGVYRTDDNGLTFRQLGSVSHTEGVSVDFTDPLRATLLATKHEAATISLSTDGGATWQDLTATFPGDIGYATGPVVIDSTTFVLGTSHGDGSGVFRSTDGGRSWVSVFSGGVSGRPLITADGAIYWVLESTNQIITSDDNGATWAVVNADDSGAPRATSLIELPGGVFAALGDTAIIESSDEGRTWRTVGPPLPFAPAGMTYSAAAEAFYVWRFDCDFSTDDPIQPDSIMRLTATSDLAH